MKQKLKESKNITQCVQSLLLLLLMLLGGTNSVWAEQVTFTFNSSGVALTQNGITVSGATATNNDGYQISDSNGGTITVSSATNTITNIVFTYGGPANDRTGGGTSVTTPGYSYTAGNTTATWTGSNSFVSIQYENKVRITQMVVTYTTNDSPSGANETIPTGTSDKTAWSGTAVTTSANMITKDEYKVSEINYQKYRTGDDGGTWTFNVRPGYKVTGISIKGYSNNTNVSIPMTSLTVDGGSNILSESYTFTPKGNDGSGIKTLTKAGLNATNKIVCTFDNSAVTSTSGDNQKQIMAVITIYYEEITPRTVTFSPASPLQKTVQSLTEPVGGLGIFLPVAYKSATDINPDSGMTLGNWQYGGNPSGKSDYKQTENISFKEAFYNAEKYPTCPPDGKVIYHTLSGLAKGTYELCLAVGASSTKERGGDPQAPIGNDMTKVYAGDKEMFIPVKPRVAVAPGEENVVVFTIEVTEDNGSIEYGLKNVKKSGNWYILRRISVKKIDTEAARNWYLGEEPQGAAGTLYHPTADVTLTSSISSDATLRAINTRGGGQISPTFAPEKHIYTVNQNLAHAETVWTADKGKSSQATPTNAFATIPSITADYGHGTQTITVRAEDGTNGYYQGIFFAPDGWSETVNRTADGVTLNKGESININGQDYCTVGIDGRTMNQRFVVASNSSWYHTESKPWLESANASSQNVALLNCLKGQIITISAKSLLTPTGATLIGSDESGSPKSYRYYVTQPGNIVFSVPREGSIKSITINNSKTTIGALDAAWNEQNVSDTYTLTLGNSCQFTFKNTSASGEDFYTWCLLGKNSNNTDVIATRPFGYTWIQNNPEPKIIYEGEGATWANYLALLREGSPTTVTVSYHDGKIYVSAVNKDTENNRTYTLTYASNNVSGDVNLRFHIDHTLLENFTYSPLATPVTGVSLNKAETTLTAGGETETLTATVAPNGATYKDVVWSISDAAVATVSSDGVVTPVAGGSANITATTLDGLYTAICEVTVNPLYSYTVNAVDVSSNVLKEFKAGIVAKGSTFRVYYPAYILHNGTLYNKAPNGSHPDYAINLTVDADNKLENITYTATATANVVAYFEGEDLPEISVINDKATATEVSSNGALGRYGNELDHQITTLNQGKYKIYGYARSGNGSGSYPYSFKAGYTEVFTGSIAGGNGYQTLESSEFTIENDRTPLTLKLGGGNATGIDFLYIVRTGDYTPVLDNKVKITFTTEDRQAVAVVSTPNYGVTASVANGNMTTDGTALKMETATAVTFNIPEGYTATMKFDASNNLGIKVDDVSLAASAVRNLNAGNHTITKGGTMNVSMITIELTPINNDAELTSVTSTAIGAEVTPSGNNVWGVVLPYDYVGETVPVTLNYENANSIVVKDGVATIQPVSSAAGSASYNFNIGTQIALHSYTVELDTKIYTINVLRLAQEYEKNINVTDFNYYVGTSGISADGNGLDRDLNGVNFTFTGGQGVKVNSESLITVRTRSNTPGTVTIALNGSNTGAHITKVVLGGSGFTAEAANYLTMTGGHISFRNSSELMVVPTTSTNTITFQSNGTDVNITSFTIYTDAALSFTKVTPTATIDGIADKVIVNSTVTPTLTTTPKNFKMAWTYVTNKSNSTIDANTGVIAVGGKTGSDRIKANFAGNEFYVAINQTKDFTTVSVDAPTIEIASGFVDGETESGSYAVTLATSAASTIYYTTDGTEPTKSSTQYSSPFNISETTTVKAIAVYNQSGTEVISTVATKKFSYFDSSIYKQKYNSDKSQVAALVVTPNVDTRNTYYNMKDQILKDGETDACVLSWGSYTWCSPNSSNNKYDGTVRGTYASLNEQPGKTQAIDGYVNTIMTNNNPKSESGTIYNDACAMGNDPLNLPVIGSFARFQPLYNGTITVWILQNGSSDWHSYDDIDENNGRIPEGSIKGDESYQLDKLRRRPTYVCDEFGTALSNGEDGNAAVVTATLADDAKFDPKTFNAIASAVYGTKTSSQYKSEEADLYDDATNVTTLPTDNSSQAIVDYWQGLIKSRGWTAGGAMNEGHNNTGLVLTPNNGFELMIKQYVKYTFPVIAGKSYYVVGSATNNGLCAAQFTRSNNDVAVDASPIVISETANDFSAITSNVGEQVNVQLNRTFTAGKWYSLVLPFSMNDIQVKQYFGENAAIYWFDSTDSEGNIHWVKHHYQMINAGIPVLIKVTKNFTSGSQIKNVLIQTDQIREYGFGGDYVMTGTWAPTTMPVNCYYISNTASSQDGKEYIASIYRTSKVTNTNGLRAWVRPTSPTASKLYGISFTSILDEETTETPTCISEVLEDTDEIVTPALNNEDLFNIGGQRVSAVRFNRLPKGVYIQNGNKFIKK